ncbi:MAG: hypothetical protein EOO20_20930 [Chryseobacterium sp.]|nr:MAG: hypothetical protein EOO20_20930 [Chryseobacterium sp.]
MENILKIRQLFRLSERNKALAVDLVSYAFVLLFVYTAASKFLTLSTFQNVLRHYPLLNGYTVFTSYAVPIAELIVALLLIVPRTKLIGLYGSLGLMSIFLIYILFMLFTLGPNLPCSCGGIIAKLSWKQHIWFNSVLILMAFFAIKVYK